MPIASLLLVVIFVVTQADSVGADFFTSRFYYAARLIGAILLATLIPLHIDRRARRSSRSGR
jgi:uncharacterized integral membrane protein